MSEHEKRIERKLDRIVALLETLTGQLPRQEENADPLRNVKGLAQEDRMRMARKVSERA